MKINFNNVRKQAVFAYGRLVRELNAAIDNCGNIKISSEQIQEHMDDLRQLIGSIAYTYDPNNAEDFKDLGDEIGEIPIFNPEKEETEHSQEAKE